MADLELRPMSREDVDRCVELHVQSFPGFFLSQLGPRFLREFYRGFLGDPDGIAVVAVGSSGEVFGCVVGTFEPHGYFSRLVRRQLRGFVAASVLAVVANPRTAGRLLRAVRYRGQVPIEVSGALLSSIAIDPQHQGSGIGTRLIEHFAARARERKMAAYLLTDRDENAAANAFYVRNGWTLAGSYQTSEGRGMNCYVLNYRGVTL